MMERWFGGPPACGGWGERQAVGGLGAGEGAMCGGGGPGSRGPRVAERVAWRVLEGTGRAVGRDDAVRGAAGKGREGQSVLSKDVKDETTRRRRLPELWYGHGTRRGMAVMGACVAWDRSG